jgi:hypothetical protein
MRFWARLSSAFTSLNENINQPVKAVSPAGSVCSTHPGSQFTCFVKGLLYFSLFSDRYIYII